MKLLQRYVLVYISISGCTTSNDCQEYNRGFCDFSNVTFGNCVVCSSLPNSHIMNRSCENADLGELGMKACRMICEGKKLLIKAIFNA